MEAQLIRSVSENENIFEWNSEIFLFNNCHNSRLKGATLTLICIPARFIEIHSEEAPTSW